MDDDKQPGTVRSTADRTFDELRKQVAERNEQTHKAARKLRAASDQKKLERRRRDDDRV